MISNLDGKSNPAYDTSFKPAGKTAEPKDVDIDVTPKTDKGNSDIPIILNDVNSIKVDDMGKEFKMPDKKDAKHTDGEVPKNNIFAIDPSKQATSETPVNDVNAIRREMKEPDYDTPLNVLHDKNRK
jgi:hypothetical protein